MAFQAYQIADHEVTDTKAYRELLIHTMQFRNKQNCEHDLSYRDWLRVAVLVFLIACFAISVQPLQKKFWFAINDHLIDWPQLEVLPV